MTIQGSNLGLGLGLESGVRVGLELEFESELGLGLGPGLRLGLCEVLAELGSLYPQLVGIGGSKRGGFVEESRAQVTEGIGQDGVEGHDELGDLHRVICRGGIC